MGGQDVLTLHLAVFKNLDETYKIENIEKHDKPIPNVIDVFDVSFPIKTQRDVDNLCINMFSKHINGLYNIVSLSLTNCNLTEVPDSLSVLKLKTLDLSNNELKQVPSCLFDGLKKLTNLNLSNNKIKTFLSPPRCAKNLSRLFLLQSGMDHFPDWIFNCEYLEELSCSFCIFTKRNIRLLQSNLKKIVLNNCEVKPENLLFTNCIYGLKYLDLGNLLSNKTNTLHDITSILDNPKWKFSIQVLILKNVGLHELPSNIGLLRNLKEIQLQGNGLFDLPTELTNIENLEVIDISYNMIYKLPENFEKLANLKSFKASYNKISEINLKNMHYLKYLDLYDNQIDSICLSSNNLIEYIDLDENFIDDEYMCSICDNYYEKRNNLRTFESCLNRKIGPIIAKSDDLESEKSYDDVFCNCVSTTCSKCMGNGREVVFDELWDYSVFNPNQPTDSDNEFNGEEVHEPQFKNMETPDLMSNNDESLFIDAD